MPKSPKVIQNDIDLTYSVADPTTGISGVVVRTKRGKFNDPSQIVTSWPQFEKLYGGLVGGAYDDPLLAKRALERGSALRVCKVGHYTDITDKTTLTAEYSTALASSIVTLSGALSGTASIDLTVNGTTITQAFTTSMANTWALLAQKVLTHATVGALVTDAFGVSNMFILAPKSAALTVSASLTNAGGVTVSGVTTKATFDTAYSGGVTAFALTPKNPGADYDNVVTSIKNASNGNASYFDVEVIHLLEPSLKETYRNLRIVGNPSVADSHYLDDLINRSNLIDATYNNLSSTSGQQRPVNMTLKFSGGDDGDALTDADYIGDSSSRLGIQAFNAIDDVYQLAVLGTSSPALAVAAAAYAQNRGDLQFFIHLDNSNDTEAALVALRDGTNVDTKYAMFFAGGLIVTDPQTSQERSISELGDVLGMAATTSTKFGLWYSFSGKKRGYVNNALGIVNNFGTAGNTENLDYLCQHGVNVVVNQQKRNYLKSCYTGQIGESQLSFGSITRLLIYMKKSLGPLLEEYVEDPNDMSTWRLIYQNGKPFMERLKTKRAIFDYDWQGDQFANTLNDLVINNADEVGQGIYRLVIFIKAITPLIEIRLDVVLTQSGVSFEESLQLIQP